MVKNTNHAPLRIICFGDSVTNGARPGVKEEETFRRLLDRKLKEAGVGCEVINAGVGGNNTGDALARMEEDVLSRKPTHVVIMFGINDSWIDDGKTASRLTVAQYTANLGRVVEQVLATGAQAVVMTANPVWSPYTPERNVTLKSYVEAARQVARRQGTPLLDVYARFAEANIEGAALDALLVDGMHPGPAGHAVIAEMLAEWFLTGRGRT